MRYRAYLFDVQGTLLDFFQPVRKAVSEYLGASAQAGASDCTANDFTADDFTRAWRANYFDRTKRLTPDPRGWRRVQDEYALGFADVCATFGLPVPTAQQAATVASAWQRLEPWPDVAEGLGRIRAGAFAATLSNTDMSTMIGLFKALDIGWDAIFTAELFGAFKPDPMVYRGATRLLGVPLEQTALVACHPYDVEAARALGMGAIFIRRPDEYGDSAFAHDIEPASVDQYVTDLREIL